jgi:hypothetical protein
MTRRILIIFAWFELASLLLTACASSPKMIASFPNQDSPGGETDSWLDYKADMTLEVWNQKTASKQASSLVRRWGGYVKNIHFDTYPGGPNTILEIAVPSQYFYDLRQDLLNLGTLVDEHIYGESNPRDHFDDSDQYSYLSLKMVSGHETPPSYRVPFWSHWPLVQQAWMNAVKIVRFLLITAFWFLVIAGPLFLFGYGMYRLGKRSNRNG